MVAECLVAEWKSWHKLKGLEILRSKWRNKWTRITALVVSTKNTPNNSSGWLSWESEFVSKSVLK